MVRRARIDSGTEDNPNAVNNIHFATPSDGVAGIQAAADEIESAGGGAIHLVPNATYNLADVTDDLRLPSNCVLNGHGATIQGPGNGGSLLSTPGEDVVVRNKDFATESTNITVRDLTVDGGFTTGERSGFGGMVHFTNVKNVYVDNLTVSNGYRHNLELVDAQDCLVTGLYSDTSWGDDAISVSDGGIEFGGVQGASNSRRIWFVGCHSENAGADPSFTGDGFEVDDGPEQIYFIGCSSVGHSEVGFTTKVHENEYAPRYIYYYGCTADKARALNDGTPSSSHNVSHVHWRDCDISNEFTAGAENLHLKGGTVGKSVIWQSSEGGLTPSGSVNGVTFNDQTGSGAAVLVEQGTDIVIRDNHMIKSAGTPTKFVNIKADGATVSQVRVLGNQAEMTDQNSSGVVVETANGGEVNNITVAGNEITNATTGVNLLDGATSYTGISLIRDNTFENMSFNDVRFVNTAVRQHFITLGNVGDRTNASNPNASPEQPISPAEGWVYLDDGANVNGGSVAWGYYNGSEWIYAPFDTPSA